MGGIIEILRRTATRGTTYGALGAAGTSSVALAQPASSMPDTSHLTPSGQLIVILVATVLPLLLQFAIEVFKRPNKDDRK